MGRSAVWQIMPFDDKTYRPKFLIGRDMYSNWSRIATIGRSWHFGDIARIDGHTHDDLRLLFVGFACGHTISYLDDCRPTTSIKLAVRCSAFLNSFAFDYVLRSQE